MISFKISLLILSSAIFVCFGKTLTYVDKCSESDANLNDCIVDRANKLIPIIAPGDSKNHVPSLLPFEFTKIVADLGSMHMELINGKIYGVDKAVISKAEFKKEDSTLRIYGIFPNITVLSDYEASGKISILPIEGKGPFEMSLLATSFDCLIKMDNWNRESKDNIKFISAEFHYTYNDGKFFLGNLFNGNKQLGDPVNKLISEEHQSINEEFKPTLVATVNTIIETFIGPIINEYHYVDIIDE